MSARTLDLAPSPADLPLSEELRAPEPAQDRLWWCRLPRPLRHPELLGDPEADWPWRPVRLLDSSPDRCLVRLEMPGPDESEHPLTLRGNALEVLHSCPA